MTGLGVPAAAAVGVGGSVVVLLLAHHAGRDPRPPDAWSMGVAAATISAAAVLAARPVLVLPVLVLGLAAAVVDVRERRLPDVLTGPLAAATAVAAVAQGALVPAVIAGGTTAAVATGLKLLAPEALGWGDVKLLPSLAATLAAAGPGVVYRGVAFWLLLVLLTAAGCWAAAGRGGREDVVPFGPALVAATLGALVT